jgi:hypothetical protein
MWWDPGGLGTDYMNRGTQRCHRVQAITFTEQKWQNYKFVPLQKSTLGWALQWPLHLDCFRSFEHHFAWAFGSPALCTRCSTFLMDVSAKSPGLKKWWPRCLNLNIASAVVLSTDRHSTGECTYVCMYARQYWAHQQQRGTSDSMGFNNTILHCNDFQVT